MIWSPRTACVIATFLAIVMCLSVLWSATHHRESETRIHPCALVLTREHGPRCLP